MENGKYNIKATFTFERFDAEQLKADMLERLTTCESQPATLLGTTFYDGNPLNVYIGTSTPDPA